MSHPGTTASAGTTLQPENHRMIILDGDMEKVEIKNYWKGVPEYQKLAAWPLSEAGLLAYRHGKWKPRQFYRCPGACGRVYQHLPLSTPNKTSPFYSQYLLERAHHNTSACKDALGVSVSFAARQHCALRVRKLSLSCVA